MSTPPPATAQQVGDFYSALGPLLSLVWDDNYHFGYWHGPDDDASIAEATDRLTDLTIERLGVGPRDRVLDVGCGVGKPALRLAAVTGAEVLGISVNGAQIRTATERAAAAGLSDRVRFAEADAMALPFADRSFDAVLALESLLHMDRRVALAEAARVLRPGGRLVLTDLTRPKATAAATATITSLVTAAEYPALLAQAGLCRHELTDISEHTRGTTPRLTQNIRRHRREFEARYGVSLQSLLDATTSSAVAAQDIGCVVVVAHRPPTHSP